MHVISKAGVLSIPPCLQALREIAYPSDPLEWSQLNEAMALDGSIGLE